MWFTETPWPPLFICLGLAALFWAAWFSTRRGLWLIVSGGLVAAAAGVYFVEALIVTEAERVEAAVLAIASAYQRGDLEETLSYVAEDAADIRSLIESSLRFYEVKDDLRITDLSVTMGAEGEQALAHFRANATIVSRADNYRGSHPSRWHVTWRREDGRWKVVAVQPLHVVSGEPIGFPGGVR
ncbi:MAG: nuclear transport factor 2 family protein [Planctomycetes bacterium]|nr:nuclear transport factor 2 family protein [Planctomycetota bacterium]